ncbi:unnamed protein product [Symbiodinium microadriaticum]|nr:unnamed protein product [Symbiodinium sp. KB8]CAE7887501.1 unnamed protein product [Symbiodinium microadriaticum]
MALPLPPLCGDHESFEACSHSCCGWCNSTNQCITSLAFLRRCSDYVQTESMKDACFKWQTDFWASMKWILHGLLWLGLGLLGLSFLFWFFTGFAWACVWGRNQILEARRAAARRRREAASRVVLGCVRRCRLFGREIDEALMVSEVLEARDHRRVAPARSAQ